MPLDTVEQQTAAQRPTALGTDSMMSLMGLGNRIPIFTGDTRDIHVKQFLEQVEIISKVGNWSTANMVAMAKISCSGDARFFISTHPVLKSTDAWDIFKTSLIERFAPRDSTGGIERTFQRCVQRTGECVDAYVSRLRNVGERLFVPSQDVSVQRTLASCLDQRLVGQFTEGLLPSLRRPVLTTDPASFEEAIKAAKKAEKIEQQLGTYDHLPVNMIGSRMDDNYGYTRPNINYREFDREHTSERKGVECVCAVNEIPNRNRRYVNSNTRYPSGNTNRRVDSNITRSFGRDKMCFNCEEIGHISRDCQKPREYEKKSSETCKRCNQTGHSIANCRTKLPKNNLNCDQPPETVPTGSAQ